MAQVASLLDERAVADNWGTGYLFEGFRAAARGFQGRSTQQHRPGFGRYQMLRIPAGLVLGDVEF